MKPEATRAAENILRAGGNAFDAAVAGQAVLGLVDPAANGIGSDAEILIYDAKTRQPYSSMPKHQPRNSQQSSGTTRTTGARFPPTMAFFRDRSPAPSTHGTFCSTAGVR